MIKKIKIEITVQSTYTTLQDYLIHTYNWKTFCLHMKDPCNNQNSNIILANYRRIFILFISSRTDLLIPKNTC